MSVYVLDANIVSYYLKEQEQVILNIENAVLSGDELFIAPIAYYEVRRGLLAVGADKLMRKFDEFCNMFAVGQLDNSILDIAAEIYAALRKKGRTIDDADILIAAYCINSGFTLVTHNMKHFKDIPDLSVVDWVTPD